MLQHYRTFACSGIYRVNLHFATRVINCSRGDRFQICNRRGSLCFLNSVSKQTVATSCNPQKDDIRKNWDTDEDDLSARYIREYSKEVFESPKIGEMNNSVNNNLKTKLDVNPIDVLSAFDPDNPPKDLQDLQIWLECQAQQESVLKFQKEVDGARERRDYSSLGKVQKEVLKWYQPLRDAIDAEQKRFLTAKDKTKDMNKFGPYLCTLPAEKIALLLANHAISHCLAHAEKSHHGSTLTSLALEIGEAFETEVMVQKAIAKKLKEKSFYNLSKFENEEAMEELEDFLETSDDGSSAVLPDEVSAFNVSNWRYSTSHRQHFLEQIYRDSDFRGRLKMKRAYRRAQEILDKEESWPHNEQLKVGAALVQILVDEAKVKLNDGKVENAFKYHKVWLNKKLVGWISIHHSFYTSVMEDFVNQKLAFSTRHKPMVVPPDPWVSPTHGGYKWLKVNVMRFHGSNIQKDALNRSDLSMAYDGLNILGQVPWKINKTILKVALHCWNAQIPVGDIPSFADHELPEEPVNPKKSDETFDASKYTEYREAIRKYKKINQKNMDLKSIRCSAILKLKQAQDFQDYERIYFPYNMDFRGRAYPIPPHLSTVGSDLCRGLLTFATAKRLGPKGLFWIKVHLANLAGHDKVTFEERAHFTDQNMENIRAAVEDPFGENRWWMDLEEPFQALATCHEIINAIDSGDPESYECSLPIHMDGSCNGLQHYAALGRDPAGGRAVNLCKEDRPQDVYTGVMQEVIRIVQADAADLDFDVTDENLSKVEIERIQNHERAKLVNGLIDRSVVKRTVMTSVYGVTFIGARKQINDKIEEKLKDKGVDIDEIETEIFHACGYLAKVTIQVMGTLFTGARQTMNWLTTCARLISKYGQPVSFVSPIGIPVIQPYRQPKSHLVATLMQVVLLANQSDDLPVHKQRQASAFPPNFVHSLDASHMILTALEMDRRGLFFAAVHDSFWTHACDIDEMNVTLRDCFVQLYDQPLLENVKAQWEIQYPNINFPDLPTRGDLNLEEVRSAPYFFQ